jgi:hypothetical protein
MKALEKAHEARLRKKLEREEALKAKIEAEKAAERERRRKEMEEVAREVWQRAAAESSASKVVGAGRPKPKKSALKPLPEEDDMSEEDVMEEDDMGQEEPVNSKPPYFAKGKNRHHQVFPPEPQPSKEQMYYYQVFSS